MATASHLIDAFCSLSPSDRLVVLDRLTNLPLTSHEWRLIKAKADAKSLKYDLVGSLPIELVIEVFSYLDILDPFRLQCVRAAPLLPSILDRRRLLIALLGIKALVYIPPQSTDTETSSKRMDHRD